MPMSGLVLVHGHGELELLVARAALLLFIVCLDMSRGNNLTSVVVPYENNGTGTRVLYVKVLLSVSLVR